MEERCKGLSLPGPEEGHWAGGRRPPDGVGVKRAAAECLDREMQDAENDQLTPGLPLPSGRRLGDLPAILRSLPRLSGEDAAAFAADIQAAREANPAREVRDPWAS